MVDLVRRLRLLVQRGDRAGDEIDRHDINLVPWPEGKGGESCKEDKRANHIELGRFGSSAVTQDDAGPKYYARHIGQELPHHMLAEFLGARIRIVVRAIPING